MTSGAVQFRRDFWTKYAELYPDDGVPAGWGRSNVWIPGESPDFHVSIGVLRWGTAVWLRGRKRESSEAAESRVGPLRDSFRKVVGEAFESRLNFEPGTEWDEEGEFDASREFDVNDPENWEHMAAWLHYMLHIYLRLIDKAQAPAR